MRLLFDHGTLVLAEPPDLSLDFVPGLLWDDRVALFRAPAFRYLEMLEAVAARGSVRGPRRAPASLLVFPDFELIHRRDSGRRWLVEIVGFWTPDYLTQKLRRLRAARLDRLILCIDERRRCAETDIPRDASVVRYKKRIDPASVLAVVEGR